MTPLADHCYYKSIEIQFALSLEKNLVNLTYPPHNDFFSNGKWPNTTAKLNLKSARNGRAGGPPHHSFWMNVYHYKLHAKRRKLGADGFWCVIFHHAVKLYSYYMTIDHLTQSCVCTIPSLKNGVNGPNFRQITNIYTSFVNFCTTFWFLGVLELVLPSKLIS